MIGVRHANASRVAQQEVMVGREISSPTSRKIFDESRA